MRTRERRSSCLTRIENAALSLTLIFFPFVRIDNDQGEKMVWYFSDETQPVEGRHLLTRGAWTAGRKSGKRKERQEHAPLKDLISAAWCLRKHLSLEAKRNFTQMRKFRG
ncbi:hypothetical protein, unlikely [Trypanosoma congolense IL3000]|uniref:Uncharacterized protein n=1 Tax=Trypanosoma congolense (strain IL3000) TaxID=1068625 RepID=F9W9I8_TRYCI|nr:hypothetical protein, unlikely [Trypanosoma congolense IL3000]